VLLNPSDKSVQSLLLRCRSFGVGVPITPPFNVRYCSCSSHHPRRPKVMLMDGVMPFSEMMMVAE